MKKDLEKELDKSMDDEDTLYFGDVDKSYEAKQKPYSEDDMYENYKPLTNTNSVEYDDGDYAYSNYELDDADDKDNRKKIIIGYIVVLLVVVLVVTFFILN